MNGETLQQENVRLADLLATEHRLRQANERDLYAEITRLTSALRLLQERYDAKVTTPCSRTLTAAEASHLFLMGQSQDGVLKLGEGAAAAIVADVDRLRTIRTGGGE